MLEDVVETVAPEVVWEAEEASVVQGWVGEVVLWECPLEGAYVVEVGWDALCEDGEDKEEEEDEEEEENAS